MLTESSYLHDRMGNLLPTRELEAHLDTVLDVGRVIHREVRQVFATDPQITHLREEESKHS
ncbi:hypothetical protein BFN03_13320 [Rhodococcus sp. WMMA185]|nr:hypothetical protein BFN03_13320 [Rhodococcus sp. WMMA185]